MGSSASVHNVEVSFVSETTGQILNENEINKINNEVIEILNNNFYENYKKDNCYDVYKTYLEVSSKNNANVKWW